jgi:hypothetical protein
MHATLIKRLLLVIAVFASATLFLLVIPAGVGWTPVSPVPDEHVTTLRLDPANGRVYAGTQGGQILERSEDGRWAPAGSALPEGAAVTALLTEPELLAGTVLGLFVGTSGSWEPVTAGLPGAIRVSELAAAGPSTALLVAGSHEFYVSWDRGMAWRPVDRSGLPEDLTVYRLLLHGGRLYAATVGDGVYQRRGGVAGEDPWVSDNSGLPRGIKVFAFQPLPDGSLVIGTDQGIYRQTVPEGPWTPLGEALQRARVLSLAILEDEEGDWLWAGTDRLVYRALIRPGAEAVGPWQDMTAGEELRRSVSWIVPTSEGVLIAAGDIYRYGPRASSWRPVLVLALLLAAVALAAAIRPRGSK